MTAKKKQNQNNINKISVNSDKNINLEPKTQGHRDCIRAIVENDVTFVIGPAGSSKTHISTALGLQKLLSKRVEKFIISRPIVESGEKLGALPGDVTEKTDPYMAPIKTILHKFLSHSEIQQLFNNKQIEVLPLAYMRGISFESAYVLIDECQNATYDQIKMILTRLGKGSIIVLTGDPDQSDLPAHKKDDFMKCVDKLKNIEGVAVVKMCEADIMRHDLVAKILRALNRSDQ